MAKRKKRISVGQTLRQMREELNLGIKTAAPQVDISYTYLSKVENGHKAPSPDLVMKLCQLYNADPDLVLANLGGLPPDIRQIVENHGKEAFELLREMFGDSVQSKEIKS